MNDTACVCHGTELPDFSTTIVACPVCGGARKPSSITFGPHSTAADLYAHCYLDASYKMGSDREDIAREVLAELARDGVGRDLLDVGAGRGELVEFAKSLGYRATGLEIVSALCTGNVFRFDGLPNIDDEDQRHDVVTCLDVLEHVLPEITVDSLRELTRVSRVLVLSIHHGPHLVDGVNLHCNQRPRSEWVELFREAGMPAATSMRMPSDLETWWTFRR